MTRRRFDELDGLRGLAALGVVVHHCLLALPEPAYARLNALLLHTPLKIVVYGRPFVILFFVLSGFVLTASLLTGASSNLAGWLAGFWAKRVTRIYIPYAASLVLSAVVYAAVQPLPQLVASPLLRETWAFGLSFDVVRGHALLLGDRPGASFNFVDWSLVYELRISLLMPLLVWVMVRVPLLLGVAAVIGLAAIADAALWACGYSSEPYFASAPAESLLYTLHFVPFFLCGGLLYLRLGAVEAALRRRGAMASALLLLVATGCLMSRRDLLQGVGAVLLVAAALSVPTLSRILAGSAAQFLGRISYSLYLVHVPIIAGLGLALASALPLTPILLLAILVSLGVAILGERFVERPSIRLGRLLDAAARSARPAGCA